MLQHAIRHLKAFGYLAFSTVCERDVAAEANNKFYLTEAANKIILHCVKVLNYCHS